MKKYILLSLLLASAISNAQKLQITSSFSILGDIAHEIGDERVVVNNIINANQDAHNYAITPKDLRQLKKADLILIHGLGFETSALTRAIKESKIPFIVASEGINPLKNDSHDHDHGHDHDHEGHDHEGHDHDHDGHDHEGHDHDHEGHDHDHDGHDHEAHEHGHGHHHHSSVDPHIWHDPILMKTYAQNIAQAMIKKDPEGKNYYSLRLKKYQKSLDDLDSWAKNELKSIPVKNRKVLTEHDAFSYLGKRYHIQFIAPQGISTDSEASAKTVAAIARQIKKENIRAIFLENIKNDRLLQQLSKETNRKVSGKLYSDALGEDSSANSYLKMMHHNIHSISQALKQ